MAVTAAATAAAKSLQSCPTLCDPIDGSPSNAKPVLHFHCLCKQSGHSLQAPVAEEACLVGLPEGLVGPGDHEDSLHQAFGGDHPNDAVLPPFFSSTCPLRNV